jgi:hypothetical protein
MNCIKAFKVLALSLSIIFCLTAAAIGQDKPVYVLINYIKTDRNKGGAYVELIKNYGSKIFQTRVNSGEILSWSLYAVGMSTEDSEDYNFVGVTSSNSVKGLMESAVVPLETLKKLMPGTPDKMMTDVLATYGEVRQIKNGVILKLQDFIPSTATRKTLEVNYMKVPAGKDADYLKLEKEIFKPLHQERVNNGQITSWGCYAVMYPWSDSRPYNYITTNGFNDWDKMMSTDYAATYKKVFPKGDMTKLGAQTSAARSMYKTEVWSFVTRVDETTK